VEQEGPKVKEGLVGETYLRVQQRPSACRKKSALQVGGRPQKKKGEGAWGDAADQRDFLADKVEQVGMQPGTRKTVRDSLMITGIVKAACRFVRWRTEKLKRGKRDLAGRKGRDTRGGEVQRLRCWDRRAR